MHQITLSQELARIKKENPELINYSLTLDNFFKMCLIMQRMNCDLPIIIMGESGVGKTALIRFLVETVFEHTLICFNVHAGINEARLIEWNRKILEAVEIHSQQKKHKIWVFFDEFNTTDEFSYIKEIMMDRRFQGKPFPENIVFLAACNPYRYIQESKHKSAGIKKRNVPSDGTSNLAFKVKPPPLSMINIMWDYQQLEAHENKSYIGKMLEILNFQSHQKLVQTVSQIHEYLKDNKEISSVSLRDVARLKEICLWFLKRVQEDSSKVIQTQKDLESPKEKAILLGLTFCYGMRLSENSERKVLYNLIEKNLSLKKGIALTVVENEQKKYCQNLKMVSEKIAINRALR